MGSFLYRDRAHVRAEMLCTHNILIDGIFVNPMPENTSTLARPIDATGVHVQTSGICDRVAYATQLHLGLGPLLSGHERGRKGDIVGDLVGKVALAVNQINSEEDLDKIEKAVLAAIRAKRQAIAK